ncbi:MAG: MFS transporter [Nocardioides sp.]
MATLVAGQIVGATGITIGIATASLLAEDLSGSEKLAGLAQTSQVLGTAVASYLLARLMSRRGRRAGLALGYLLGAAGSVVVVVAGAAGSMLLLLAGAVLLGSTTAANNAARYAATDLAPEESRGRALGVVVWAATIGAVLGPNLTGPAGRLADRLGIPALTGPFLLGSFGMLLAALILWLFLRPDPLLIAREHAGVSTAVVRNLSWVDVRAVLRERPILVAAIVGLASSHAVMVAVMVMTPLHMHHGGSDLRVIGFVISVHVLGMFAFSPLSGWATDRWGAPVTLAVGGVVLLVSLVLSGLSPEGELVADLCRTLPARPRLVLRHGRLLEPGRRAHPARGAHRHPRRSRPGDEPGRRWCRRARRRGRGLAGLRHPQPLLRTHRRPDPRRRPPVASADLRWRGVGPPGSMASAAVFLRLPRLYGC